MKHKGHDFRVRVVEGVGGWPSFASLWCKTCWSVDGTRAALEVIRCGLVPRLHAAIHDRLPHVAVELGL